MRFQFTAEAERDIEEIGDFIARDNPRRATSFVAELRTRCRALVKSPRAHPLRNELGDGVRAAVHGRYLIFYEIDDQILKVLRVIHGARDITEL